MKRSNKMKKITTVGILALISIFISGCTDAIKVNQGKSEVISSASISEESGKHIAKELEEVQINVSEIPENKLSNEAEKKWNELTKTIEQDINNEQISEKLKDELDDFEKEIKKDTLQAKGDVKKKLESIDLKIIDILSKLN